MFQLRDVSLHPVRAEVRAAAKGLEIQDQAQISSLSRGSNGLFEPSVCGHRALRLSCDEGQGSRQQVFTCGNGQVVVGAGKRSRTPRGGIDFDKVWEAGRVSRFVVAARTPEDALNGARRGQSSQVKEFEFANVIESENGVVSRDLLQHRHPGRKAGSALKFLIRFLEPEVEAGLLESPERVAFEPDLLFLRIIPVAEQRGKIPGLDHQQRPGRRQFREIPARRTRDLDQSAASGSQ